VGVFVCQLKKIRWNFLYWSRFL